MRAGLAAPGRVGHYFDLQMNESFSKTGSTLAFFVDLMLVLFISFGPFFLPRVARYGPKIRVAAGIALIGLGVLLAAIFFLPPLFDPNTHFLLAAFIMFISMGAMFALYSIGLGSLDVVFLIILPFVYAGLGFGLSSIGGEESIEPDRREQ